MIDFSIVIPAKNEEKNIDRCLDSILRVDWDPCGFEIIVVDNGSADNTVSIAKEKGAHVFIKPEATISGLRNFGASKANGQIIAFLDADCAVTPGWLKAASQYLGKDDVVAFGSPAILPEGATWVQSAWFNVRGKPTQIVEVEWLESANLLVKKDVFFSVGGFDESLVTCEDYVLTQKLKQYGRIISDWRVAAIHYREPSTVHEFFKKELWRSKSNYVGLFSRKVSIKELPSLIFPLLYIVFSAALCVGFSSCIIRPSFMVCWLVALLLMLWQIPFFLYSLKKNRSGKISTAIQLIILLNVYFFARGLSALKRS